MSEAYEGWAWWPGARVDHYVRAGVSLCRRWEIEGMSIVEYGDAPPFTRLQCLACVAAVNRERRARWAAAQWTVEEVEA